MKLAIFIVQDMLFFQIYIFFNSKKLSCSYSKGLKRGCSVTSKTAGNDENVDIMSRFGCIAVDIDVITIFSAVFDNAMM